jgi:hypothetical protein
MPVGTADNDVQIALATPRNRYFAKYMVLSKILQGIDMGFARRRLASAARLEDLFGGGPPTDHR